MYEMYASNNISLLSILYWNKIPDFSTIILYSIAMVRGNHGIKLLTPLKQFTRSPTESSTLRREQDRNSAPLDKST